MRWGWIEPDHPALSLAAQCALLALNWSTGYNRPAQPSALNLVLMGRLDEEYSAHPFYGSRRMTAVLRPGRVCGESQVVLAWRLSNTLETRFCLECLDEASQRRLPSVFNSDQGAQFTSTAFTSRLVQAGIQISMDS